MKIQVKKVKGAIKVEHTTTGDAWKKELQAAEKKASASIQLKGFRKGKVPADVAKKYLNRAQVFDTAVNGMLKRVYKEILEHEDVKKHQLFSNPKINVHHIDEVHCELEFEFEIFETPVIGKYKGLTLKKVTGSVSAQDVIDSIDQIKNRYATYKAKPANAEINEFDLVKFDFEGFHKGKAFANGAAKGYELEIGSNKFVPGFENQMIGLKVNSAKDIHVKFPEDYHSKDLKGADVVFKVLIHEIKEKVLPSNDDLVKDLNNPKITTYDELKDFQKDYLQKLKDADIKEEIEAEALEKILEKSEIELPQAVIQKEIESTRKQFAAKIKQQGFKDESEYYKMVGLDQATADKEVETDAKMKLQTIVIFEEIAKMENIKIEDKDIDTYLEKLNKESNIDIKKLKDMISKEELRFRIRNEKVIDIVMSTATYK